MNLLVKWISSIVKEKVISTTKGRGGSNIESRIIFNGPPQEILELVYEELVKDGGINVKDEVSGSLLKLPVLLQYPISKLSGKNPEIGISGRCDESHLLHIRNDPNCPSFVALVPPGLHNNRSVESTTDVFGINTATTTNYNSIDGWWEDGFVQLAINQALVSAGISELQREDAKRIIHSAAIAVDEIDAEDGEHRAAWRLISRIFSVASSEYRTDPGTALSLACGVPPVNSGGISAKLQLATIDRISDEFSDGFRTSIERLQQSADNDSSVALSDLLTHLQLVCHVPTAFERAALAFYLPHSFLVIQKPPAWWSVLTVEKWLDLLDADTDEIIGEIKINCINSLVTTSKIYPAIVNSDIALDILVQGVDIPNQIFVTGGSVGKAGIIIEASNSGPTKYIDPKPPLHSSPLSYKVTAEGYRPVNFRAISLSNWRPGILVTCRLATKLSLPKKPRKRGASVDWETSLSVPGSGRYELRLHVSSDIALEKVQGVSDDSTELGSSISIAPKFIGPNEYLIEVEADNKYQLDISYRFTAKSETHTCRVYMTCEDVKEEGCRSEFERLIKLNRRHLDKSNTKAVVHVDRNARVSSLQSWILDEKNIERSFIPVIIADDYASSWAPLSWTADIGPILSNGRFLKDPRPDSASFLPPKDFLNARIKLAGYIRGKDDQSGLAESATLGAWLSNDDDFCSLIEQYLTAYTSWLQTSPEIACWIDTLCVCSLESDGRTLGRIPDAIMLNPLHPLRLAWHCLAQKVLLLEADGDNPCPAASIIDPDCIPDLMTMSLQAPEGVDQVDYLSVECSSDYWSVLWNGSRLGHIVDRARMAPFDNSFGVTVGGISRGFSPAQVSRALDDISDLLSAKSIVSLTLSSAGGATDACNSGLTNWCIKKFGSNEYELQQQGTGGKLLEVYDTRLIGKPDQATIANLSEYTENRVRWYERQPKGVKPDLGIIAQLDSAQPEIKDVGMLSPMGVGGLIRHRVRRQLQGSFLSESRQGRQMQPSGDTFADKILACILTLESLNERKAGLQFSPNVHAVSSMLEENRAGFVAVSSSAIDPACFLGGWIKGTYLWDYDLPSYSHRAGDTSGYYLLSQVKQADRDALRRVLKMLPECGRLEDADVEQILLEVARRGIPTVRGLSGDDTGATGDLGLFVAVRLLQDQFRLSVNKNSILPVLSGSQDDSLLAIVVPVDPFRGYLADIARSLGNDKKDATLSRPDLLVIGVRISGDEIRIHLTPIEVKYRQGSIFSQHDALDALAQAKALSNILKTLEAKSDDSLAWRLTFQHLLLSIIGFGLRVYSQHQAADGQAGRWATYHERIAAEILSPNAKISIDNNGRLIVIDNSSQSGPLDRDSDGFAETIVLSNADAGRIVIDDLIQSFYDAVRSHIGDWALFPAPEIDSNENSSVVPVNNDVHLAEKNIDPLTILETDSRIVVDENKEGSSGIILSVGKTMDGFEPRAINLNISDTRLNQLNIGVVGDLGTGKTQFLKSIITQIVRAQAGNRGIKPRFLIFDYKRDYSSQDFVDATGAKVIKPYHLPLNLFDTEGVGESSAPWLDRFRFFADVLDKVYSGIGPVQRDKLKGAVRKAYEKARDQDTQPTLYDVHAEYRELLGGKSDSPMAIIDDLVDMEIFARDPKSIGSFDKFLNGVIVISLDSMGQDDRSKNMLVAIMLNMFYENMLRTPKRPFIGSEPQLRAIDSYLLVDEADNIMRYEFDVLRKLLLQGREFGTGIILASQYLRHFKSGGTDYREPLLTWFIHKVPNVTPAELGVLGFTSELGELSERVKTLPNHHCLYKSFNVSGEVIRGLPFFELIS